MSLQWDDTFVLGIDEIDQQHKTIVEQFNIFSEAVQQGKENEKLADMADFLVKYAQSHFVTEECYMQRYGYPKIDEQRREHAEFTNDAKELLAQLARDGASRELAVSLTGKMIRWVIQHVRKHDREMADFVKEKMRETNVLV